MARMGASGVVSGWWASIGASRMAHLEPLPLPGGDAATQNPGALPSPTSTRCWGRRASPRALLPERGGADPTADRAPFEYTADLLDGPAFRRGQRAVGVCEKATYEAQAAIELEQVTTLRGGTIDLYPFGIEESEGTWIVRLGPLFETLLEELERGQPVGRSRCASTRRLRRWSRRAAAACVRRRGSPPWRERRGLSEPPADAADAAALAGRGIRGAAAPSGALQ